MLKPQKNTSFPIIIWLASGCLLVAVMVVVGGITRLTHSGLSMVQWSLFMGSIPPLSEQSWLDTFDLYKQTPEFKLKNYDFSLEEFKSIFFWEYFHRMIGRVIGLVFIIPFCIFIIQKKFSKAFIKKLLIVFGLGALQGFMGWYMVKSGLVKDPNVSHYRLAMHLVLAFGLYAFTFWLMLEQIFEEGTAYLANRLLKNMVLVLLLIVGVQIAYGAFVSGLKAGAIYNTFPKMGDAWIAESVPFAMQKDGIISLLENHASVQFLHRSLAYIVVLFVTLIWWKSRQLSLSHRQRQAIFIVLVAVFLQATLGVFTLVYAVPLVLGVLHQLGALVLLTTIVYLYFMVSKSTSVDH